MMKIIFVVTSNFEQRAIAEMEQTMHNVVGIVIDSHNIHVDIEAYKGQGIDIFLSKDVYNMGNDAFLMDWFSRKHADLLCAFNLPPCVDKRVETLFTYGAIGILPALHQEYHGQDAIKKCIEDGHTATGFSAYMLNTGGDMMYLANEKVDIKKCKGYVHVWNVLADACVDFIVKVQVLIETNPMWKECLFNRTVLPYSFEGKDDWEMMSESTTTEEEK